MLYTSRPATAKTGLDADCRNYHQSVHYGASYFIYLWARANEEQITDSQAKSYFKKKTSR